MKRKDSQLSIASWCKRPATDQPETNTGEGYLYCFQRRNALLMCVMCTIFVILWEYRHMYKQLNNNFDIHIHVKIGDWNRKKGRHHCWPINLPPPSENCWIRHCLPHLYIVCLWTTYWRQLKSECHQTSGDKRIKFWKVKGQVGGGGMRSVLLVLCMDTMWYKQDMRDSGNLTESRVELTWSGLLLLRRLLVVWLMRDLMQHWQHVVLRHVLTRLTHTQHTPTMHHRAGLWKPPGLVDRDSPTEIIAIE